MHYEQREVVYASLTTHLFEAVRVRLAASPTTSRLLSTTRWPASLAVPAALPATCVQQAGARHDCFIGDRRCLCHSAAAALPPACQRAPTELHRRRASCVQWMPVCCTSQRRRSSEAARPRELQCTPCTLLSTRDSCSCPVLLCRRMLQLVLLSLLKLIPGAKHAWSYTNLFAFVRDITGQVHRPLFQIL